MTESSDRQSQQIDALASTSKKKKTAKKSTSNRRTTSSSTRKKSTRSKSQTSLESAIRREITKQTGIPTTASGIKNKIGRAIVDWIVGLFSGKKSQKKTSQKKGDIVADI